MRSATTISPKASAGSRSSSPTADAGRRLLERAGLLKYGNPVGKVLDRGLEVGRFHDAPGVLRHVAAQRGVPLVRTGILAGLAQRRGALVVGREVVTVLVLAVRL